jgi:hypothetical protein
MGNYARTEPFLAFGGKIDPLSEIRNAGIITSGNVVWVKHPSDADYRTVKDAVGRGNFFDTPQAAIDSPKVRNGKNDYVLVCPRDNTSAWVLTGTSAGIVLNKDNVHLMGMGAGQAFGSASVILELPGTAGTIGTFGAIYVTGDGCEVSGFFVRGTAGTSQGGSVGAGTQDGAITGGLITVGTAVSGLDLHDFKIVRTGAQWDGGTTGLVGTPRAMLDMGSAASDITVRNGYIDCGTAAKDIHAIRLPFNGQNIVIKDMTLAMTPNAALAKHILPGAGTIDPGIHVNMDRVKFIAFTNGTTEAAAFGGTMAVGAYAFMNECPASTNITQTGTPGSTFVTPLLGVGTITVGGLRNPYIGIGTAALVASGA